MTSIKKLEPLQALALMANKHKRIAINSIVFAEDGSLAIASPGRASQFTFAFRGLEFAVRVTPLDEDRFYFQMSCFIGVVPYSAQNSLIRQKTLFILSATQNTDREIAQFRMGHDQTIWLMSEYEVEDVSTPDTMIYEAVKVLQATLPYLEILHQVFTELPSASQKKAEFSASATTQAESSLNP